MWQGWFRQFMNGIFGAAWGRLLVGVYFFRVTRSGKKLDLSGIVFRNVGAANGGWLRHGNGAAHFTH